MMYKAEIVKYPCHSTVVVSVRLSVYLLKEK